MWYKKSKLYIRTEFPRTGFLCLISVKYKTGNRFIITLFTAWMATVIEWSSGGTGSPELQRANASHVVVAHLATISLPSTMRSWETINNAILITTR